jgi:ribonuclease-3 family protein
MYLIGLNLTDVNDLHKKAIKYTSGVAQASIVNHFIQDHIINEEEMDFFKRGRNASGKGRGNMDPKTYSHATGFEAIIGGLILKEKSRADALIMKAIEWIEKGDAYGKNG